MKNIKSFNEYAINESFSSFKEKCVLFYQKLKHLVENINFDLTEEEKQRLDNVNSIKDMYSFSFDVNLKTKLIQIIKENKDEVRKAYDEVFGLKEEIGIFTIISIIFLIGYIYYKRDRIKNMFKKKVPPKPYRYRDPDDDLDFLRKKEKDEEMY